MNRINEFGIEPGPYADHNGHVYVAVDVVNYQYNPVKLLSEVVPDPFVVLRDLIAPPKEYRRYLYPLSVFKQNFKKE